MLAEAMAARFGVLFVEGLDRLSRDMVEQERIIRRLEHQGIRIVGVADGYDSESKTRKLHRGMRGIINEVYLDDLREKTHRGLAGQVSRGLHAGGLSYGYRSTLVEGGHRLEIDPEQAEWVRWIFTRYAEGWSVQRIAHELNRLGVPTARGGTWATSAIYGNPLRLAGVLNNELYVGRYLWNRSQWVKDPDTGKRTRVDRPREEWSETDMPELRIVEPDLWAAARARMASGRVGQGRGKGRGGKPTSLFGGVLRCAHCGGPVVVVSHYSYGCATHKDRGTCPGVTAPRRDVDTRLVEIVRGDLLSPAALADMQAQAQTLAREYKRTSRQQAQHVARRQAELDGEIGRLVDAIASMGYSDALGARLRAAESERKGLVAPEPDSPPQADFQAAIANYRRMVETLDSALRDDLEVARAAFKEIFVTPPTIGNDERGPWVEITKPPLLAAAGGLEDENGCGGTLRFSSSRYYLREPNP